VTLSILRTPSSDTCECPGPSPVRARYPGERTLQIRNANLEKGVPVEPGSWREVQALLWRISEAGGNLSA